MKKAKERRWGQLAEENKTKYSTFAVESSGSMPPYSLLDRIATVVVDARHRELDNDPIDLESGYGKWLGIMSSQQDRPESGDSSGQGKPLQTP